MDNEEGSGERNGADDEDILNQNNNDDVEDTAEPAPENQDDQGQTAAADQNATNAPSDTAPSKSNDNDMGME